MRGTFTEVEKKNLLKQDIPKLGDRPVYVIKGDYARHDVQKIYNKGIARGNGIIEERKKAQDMINL